MKIEDDGCLNNRLNSKACRWNWKKKKAVLVNWTDWKRRRCPYSAFWTSDRVIATAGNYIMTQITDFEQFTRWHDQAKRKINDRNAFKETAITRDPWNKRSTSFVLVMSTSVWRMKTNPFPRGNEKALVVLLSTCRKIETYYENWKENEPFELSTFSDGRRRKTNKSS